MNIEKGNGGSRSLDMTLTVGLKSLIGTLKVIYSFGVPVKFKPLTEPGTIHLYPTIKHICGTVRKADVKKIAEAINAMENSTLLWVDLYSTSTENINN